jgi:hypothetical protein
MFLNVLRASTKHSNAWSIKEQHTTFRALTLANRSQERAGDPGERRMSLRHFFKPNGTQRDVIWSIIYRNGYADGKEWELPTLFSHTDATTGADVVSTLQRLYPANNNIKDTIRGAVRTLVEEGKLENCGVSGHPIYRVALRGNSLRESNDARVDSQELELDRGGEDSKPIIFEGVSYELDGDGVAVYDEDGDHVGNWDGEKIGFLNSAMEDLHMLQCGILEDKLKKEELLKREQDAGVIEDPKDFLPQGDDVQEFLKENKLEMWVEKLKGIGLTDLSFLKYITEEDLREIGMPKLHIRCILDKI